MEASSIQMNCLEPTISFIIKVVFTIFIVIKLIIKAANYFIKVKSKLQVFIKVQKSDSSNH